MSATDLKIDNAFIAKLKSGDSQAYRQVYYAFTPIIYKESLRMYLRHEDAEEVCQEVFLKLWEVRHRLDEEGSLGGLIYTMAKNTILKKIRKRAYQVVLEKYWKLNTPSTTSNTEEYLDLKNLSEVSGDFLERLPERQRQILSMRINDSLSHDEIAVRLGLSKRTVENQVLRGMKKLRAYLGKL